MNLGAAMLELVIRARERGEMDDDTLRLACRRVEERAQRIRERDVKREAGPRCERCDGRTKGELLCRRCHAEAPPRIRNAFRDSRGVDGMRKAARLVREWAHGVLEARRAA